MSTNVRVIAPTLEMGYRVAYDFNIPRKQVHSQPVSLYGLSKQVFLVYGMAMFTPEGWDKICKALEPGQHTIIYVPEYTRIKRKELLGNW